MERWEAACLQHERALAIIESSLDPEHPQAARSLAGLARARLGLGRPAEAEVAAARALAIASHARAAISAAGAST